MTEYIQGPDKQKASYIREYGGILLEIVPERLAPTGAYICVLLGTELEVAMVVREMSDLRSCRTDTRSKQWLHVDTDTLKKLLYEGGSV